MKEVEHMEYYLSGEIRSNRNYLNDNLHGESFIYYKNGNISYKCNYIDDEVHGEAIYYFISGEVECKYYYICGKGVSYFECISYNRNLKFNLLVL